MKVLGRHLIAELTDCNAGLLNDLSRLQMILKEAARKSGATVVDSIFHRYNPQGVSGIVVIAESHISIHTWPEYNYAAVDCFTCGTSVDPSRAIDHLKKELASKSIVVRELRRGIPSESEEFLAHKTLANTMAITVSE